MPTPDNLITARKSIEGLSGIEILSDWEWNNTQKKWTLLLKVTTDTGNAVAMPPVVECYVLADTIYPWGTVVVYPAKIRGFEKTFPHQLYNGNQDESIPWRAGQICVATHLRILRRHGYDVESFTSEERLRWNVLRLKEWLKAASEGELTAAGDPFELPEFPGSNSKNGSILFLENAKSFEAWKRAKLSSGIVNLFLIEQIENFIFVESFTSPRNEIIFELQWGSFLRSAKRKSFKGLWILLKAIPALDPWQAPATWGELKKAFESQGLDFDKIFKSLVNQIRDGSRHFILLGFPISEKIGESPTLIYWQPLLLPVLSAGNVRVDGFRPGSPEARWYVDQTSALRVDQRIDWVSGENWVEDIMSSRGQMSETLRKKNILIIGGGALGSIVSELLVRGGVKNLTVIDDDRLKTGNLVRHTASMLDLGKKKAIILSERLNRLSPHVNVSYIDAAFTGAEEEKEVLKKYDLIVDCSAHDDVIFNLGRLIFNENKCFVSLALGYRATRLFVFADYGKNFSGDEYRAKINPWLEDESASIKDFPREGAGCWHPIFPARADDVSLMASVAIKCLEELIENKFSKKGLTVFEQYAEASKFFSVRRIHSDW